MKKRYNTIDFIRGFALLNMIFYHMFYDLVYIFNIDFPFFYSKLGSIWQNAIAMTFILVSGLSYNFGNKNWKRFIYLSICAAILSIYTYFFMPTEFIAFGVIHFFAIATVISMILEKYLYKVNKYLGATISVVLFILTRFISDGYIGILNFKYYIPKILYSSKIFFWIGFPSDNFYSADYFPVIPWIFLFFFGLYIGKIYLDKKPKSKEINKNPISFIGRHSLIVYMLHQPVIYLILSLIFKK